MKRNSVSAAALSDKYFRLTLLLIACAGILLALFRLDTIPSGISSDILLYFSNARSIAETGRDIYGNQFPLYFSHKGILMMPVTVYAIAFFYRLLGFSHITGYLPNILMSAAGVYISGIFALTLTGSKRIGILTAAVLVLSPWHFHLTRTAFEGVFGFTLILAGMYTTLRAVDSPKCTLWFLVLFALGSFTYKATNIFLIGYPVILLMKTGIQYVRKAQFILLTGGILFIIALQWVLLFFLYKDTYATGILSHNALLAKTYTETEMNQSDAPNFLKRLMSNTPVHLTKIAIKNYSNFFSPQFLLNSGDTDNRFSTTGHGQLYYIDAVLISLGFLWFLKTKKTGSLSYILAVLFIAPVSALIANEQYAIRTYIAVFFFAILIACGIEYMYEAISDRKIRNSVLSILLVTYIMSFGAYVYRYHYLYIHYGRNAWNGINKDLYAEAYVNKSKHSKTFFGRSSEFEYLDFMYWNSLPVTDIQNALTHYDEKTLTYKNMYFIRECTPTGETATVNTLQPSELLYTPDYCLTGIEPIHRYYLPKTLIYTWKSYTDETLQKHFEKTERNQYN